MRRLLILLSAVAMLSSCASMKSSSLYYWGSKMKISTAYEEASYLDYKKQSPEAICNLLCVYEDMVTHPAGTRQVPPPGICAEYGWLLMQAQTASYFADKATEGQKRLFKRTDYSVFFPERAKELFEMEIKLYPESATFLAPLVKKLTGDDLPLPNNVKVQ